MTATTQHNALTTIRVFFADLGDGLHLLAEHISDLRKGVSSVEKAARLSDLSDAELNELGLTRDKIVEYSFRDEI